MQSLTYGNVNMAQIARIIANRVQSGNSESYSLMIGTDSQNFDKTKVVVVIALYHLHHGGIFFYDITHINRIDAISPKLQYETQLSLQYAQELISEFERLFDKEGFDYTEHLDFAIHVDAGTNGPSRKVIPEIVGWITAMGYKAVTKPQSYAASCIANKITK
jgi:hypothetical protein